MKHRTWPLFIFFVAILEKLKSAESSTTASVTDTCKSSPDERDCKNPDESPHPSKSDVINPKERFRVITQEELASKNGEDDSDIWLSIMGKVYDVTAGKSFYAKGRSYGAFSATDCTVCFVSGIFSPEEAAKHTDELSDTMLPGVMEWADFYEAHESYKFVGYLIDPRFYDEKGEPTENLIAFRKRISLLQHD